MMHNPNRTGENGDFDTFGMKQEVKKGNIRKPDRDKNDSSFEIDDSIMNSRPSKNDISME